MLTKMHKYALLYRTLFAVGFDKLEVLTVLAALDAPYVDAVSLRGVGTKNSTYTLAPSGVVCKPLVPYLLLAFRG
jgi:hypothetical protein